MDRHYVAKMFLYGTFVILPMLITMAGIHLYVLLVRCANRYLKEKRDVESN